MAKKRSPILDYLIYLAVRLGVCFVQALPPGAVRLLANTAAWLVYRIDRRHRGVAADNIRHAFPDLSEPAIDRMVRATFRHFVTMALEIVRLPRKMVLNNWRAHCVFIRPDLVVGGLTSGRPLLVVTGHFGNWEIAGVAMALTGFRTHAIARELDNPHLDHFFRRFREHTGQKLLAKKGDFDNIQQVLADGGVIATLADQDAGPRGLFVPFFGRPASTHKAVALMAIEYDVPMLVIGVPKVGEPMRYHIVAEELIDPREYAGRPDAVRAITERYTSALERVVRRHPEQYFWLHRRWKHQPKERAKKAA